MSTCEEQDMLLKFSLKKVVSLSRGHVVGNTHLNFGFSKGGLKAQWSTQPRASVATPWVSRVGAVAPCKGKSFKKWRRC